MIGPPSATSSNRDTSVASYEELRLRVLAGSSCGGHVGLVVLVREGVAAWLARPLASRSPIQSTTLGGGGGGGAAAVAMSDDFHASVIHVLANIAVARREEMNA